MTETVDAAAVRRWLRRFADDVETHRQTLTGLDAAIGDADHGTNMHRGMQAVVAELEGTDQLDPGALCKQVGMTLVRTVGGASGPLYGTLFLRMAGGADGAAWDAGSFARSLRAGVDGVVARGRAELGDKTMVDALVPALDALDAALDGGASLPAALRSAATAADAGRDATVPMLARKGRASYLGERSIGHQDPGATSSALLVTAAADALVDGDVLGPPS